MGYFLVALGRTKLVFLDLTQRYYWSNILVGIPIWNMLWGYVTTTKSYRLTPIYFSNILWYLDVGRFYYVHIFICWYSHSIGGTRTYLGVCISIGSSRDLSISFGGLIDQKFGVISQKFPKICISIFFSKCFWCLIFLNLIWPNTNMHVGISFWIRS